MIRRIAGVALSVMLLGCASGKKAAYQRLADQVNPIFVTLILKVAAIKALGPGAQENDSRLAAACGGAEHELWRLSEIDFGREEGIQSRLSFEASGLINFRYAMCGWPMTGALPPSYKPVNGTDRVLGNCRWWCLDRWSHYTGVASEFEAGARAEGVYVIALPQVPER